MKKNVRLYMLGIALMLFASPFISADAGGIANVGIIVSGVGLIICIVGCFSKKQ
ncbi:MAG: hypothetical protein RR731_07035 [Oscillospiraceae bacterium]